MNANEKNIYSNKSPILNFEIYKSVSGAFDWVSLNSLFIIVANATEIINITLLGDTLTAQNKGEYTVSNVKVYD